MKKAKKTSIKTKKAAKTTANTFKEKANALFSKLSEATRTTLTLDERNWANGLRLAGLNSLLALACAGTFGGTLAAVTLYNQWVHGAGGLGTAFPYATLFLAYSILLPITWVGFARRLPTAGLERLQVAGIGILPLVALALSGLASAGGLLLAEVVLGTAMIPPGSFFVLLLLSGLVLLAAGACTAFVWMVPEAKSEAPVRV